MMPTEQQLLALLRRESAAVPRDPALFAVAAENELASTVAHRLADAHGWNAVPAPLRAAHDEIEAQMAAYLAELDAVAARLAAAGIPLVALKNAGIARALHCPGCCPMGDVDALVERRHFRRAHRLMLESGYHFEFRSDLEENDLAAAEQGGGAEYWRTLPDGRQLWFELQWRPVAGRWIRPDQEPPADALVARSQPIPGTAVRLLAPEDNLLQVCLHTAKHSYIRAPGFRLHLDADRIIGAQTIDWPAFVATVKQLQVKTAVYFSLALAQELLDTPVPNDVLAALRPGRWRATLIRRWLDRAGLFDPEAPKFSRPAFILFTALLYDDPGGLWRGLFPDAATMRQRYDLPGGAWLPPYHLRRLADLALRRQRT